MALFSCNRCDFDAETREGLQQHSELNIHNIKDENILQEIIVKSEVEPIDKRTFYCYKCDYSSDDEHEIEEHGCRVHGMVKCDRCEYIAEDLDIMKKHKMKHTGRIIFSCNICEFETTRESMLVTHKESKHTNPEEKLNIECKTCEKSFPYLFHYNEHSCKPIFKYPCEKCKFKAIELAEIVEHVVNVHTGQTFHCSSCDFQAEDKEGLDMHVKCVHTMDIRNVNDAICQSKTEAKVEKIKCDQCDFVAEESKTFIKHIRTGHSDPTIACQYCDHFVANKDDLMNHMYDNHAEVIMIHTMAKQVNDMSEKFELFGNLFSQVFDKFNVIY